MTAHQRSEGLLCIVHSRARLRSWDGVGSWMALNCPIWGTHTKDPDLRWWGAREAVLDCVTTMYVLCRRWAVGLCTVATQSCLAGSHREVRSTNAV